MDSEYTLFIVDDAEVSRRLIVTAFGAIYTVESFESGAACLDRMTVKIPDIFLLDVDMPEMDGYTLCRQIKSHENCKGIPAIFISALDDLESRLEGYDAGGEDFIVKPYKLAELKQKIEVLRRLGEEKKALHRQMGESDILTSLVLSNLDEYSVLVKFLRSLNTCEGFSEGAEAVLTMLKGFNLEGVVQFRLPKLELTLNSAGEASPLESSVIRHVRSLGAIAGFNNRAVFNFERVSLLVNNMPISDPELCGRLRDHLAIAVETVEAKLVAMQTRQENSETKREIASLMQDLSSTIRLFGERYEDAHSRGLEKTRQLLDELDKEFVSVGMREVQEESIKEIIQSKVEQMVAIYDFSAETETTLNGLLMRLRKALARQM